MRSITPIEDRFWPKVKVGGADECWPWQGACIRKGYGQIGAGRKGEGNLLTHRLAWSLANGPIPPNAHVLHSCDNPPCCNPAHLRLGTNAENSAEKYAKGRGNTGTRNGLARLDAERVREIRRRRAQGESLQALADAYGVTIGTVGDVVYRRTWKSVD